MWNIKSEIVDIDGSPEVSLYDGQLFTSCDFNYFRLYAALFLASVNLNSPGALVVLEVINPERNFKEILSELREKCRAITIVAITTQAGLNLCSIEEARTFYACRRFVTLAEYLQDGAPATKPTFSIDIDSLVRRDLSPLFDRYKDIDLAIYLRPHREKASRKVLSGGIYINPQHTAAQCFLKLLSGRLRYATAAWYLDQEVISGLLSELSGDLKVADLRKEYLDFDFSAASSIWTGKGERKNNNEKYVELAQAITDRQSRKNIEGLIIQNSSDESERFLQRHSALITQSALELKGIHSEIILCCDEQSFRDTLTSVPHDKLYAYASDDRYRSFRSGVRRFPYVMERKDESRFRYLNVVLDGAQLVVANVNADECRDVVFGERAEAVEPKYLMLEAHNLVAPLKSHRSMKDRLLSRTKAKLIDTLAPKISSLAKGCESVAIVGNGKTILHEEWGAEIDAHDLVFRFNIGFPLTLRKSTKVSQVPPELIKASFVDQRAFPPETHVLLRNDISENDALRFTNVIHTGRRTTHWVCATIDQERQRVYSTAFDGCKLIWPHPTTYGNINRALIGRDLRLLDGKYFWIFKRQNITPSSGLIVFEFLRSIQSIKKLSLYGFDFFESGHQTRSHSLLLEKKESFPHSGDYEADYIMSAAILDGRIRLRKQCP